MKLCERLMDIDMLIHGEGGCNFIKIRSVLDTIDERRLSDPHAAKDFAFALEQVHVVLQKIVDME